ncbi:MAG: hypothetical protein KatS3mg054_0063 [Chloroflexus sp.]|nr:MAG: hypothetical protein KatS3mg054_0063 [Chloroflexus sp.]
MAILIASQDRTQIEVQSVLLDEFVLAPGNYEYLGVEVTGKVTGVVAALEYTASNPITATSTLRYDGSKYWLSAQVFGLTEFGEGVYEVVLRLKETLQLRRDTGCVFVEEGFGCLVGDMIGRQDILGHVKTISIGVWHVLRNINECPCTCEQASELYKYVTGTGKRYGCKTC